MCNPNTVEWISSLGPRNYVFPCAITGTSRHLVGCIPMQNFQYGIDGKAQSGPVICLRMICPKYGICISRTCPEAKPKGTNGAVNYFSVQRAPSVLSFPRAPPNWIRDSYFPFFKHLTDLLVFPRLNATRQCLPESPTKFNEM